MKKFIFPLCYLLVVIVVIIINHSHSSTATVKNNDSIDSTVEAPPALIKANDSIENHRREVMMSK